MVEANRNAIQISPPVMRRASSAVKSKVKLKTTTTSKEKNNMPLVASLERHSRRRSLARVARVMSNNWLMTLLPRLHLLLRHLLPRRFRIRCAAVGPGKTTESNQLPPRRESPGALPPEWSYPRHAVFLSAPQFRAPKPHPGWRKVHREEEFPARASACGPARGAAASPANNRRRGAPGQDQAPRPESPPPFSGLLLFHRARRNNAGSRSPKARHRACWRARRSRSFAEASRVGHRRPLFRKSAAPDRRSHAAAWIFPRHFLRRWHNSGHWKTPQ